MVILLPGQEGLLQEPTTLIHHIFTMDTPTHHRPMDNPMHHLIPTIHTYHIHHSITGHILRIPTKRIQKGTVLRTIGMVHKQERRAHMMQW